MSNSHTISGYCQLKEQKAWVNGKLLHQNHNDLSFKEFTKAIYKNEKLKYPKFFKMDNLSKLAFIAAELLLRKVEISKDYPSEKIAVVLENKSASLDTDEAYFQTTTNEKHYFPSPGLFVYTLPNVMLGELCIRHKLKGEQACFVAEEYNPEEQLNYVNLLLDNDLASACLAGWVEFSPDGYEALLFIKEKNARNPMESFDFKTIINLITNPK